MDIDWDWLGVLLPDALDDFVPLIDAVWLAVHDAEGDTVCDGDPVDEAVSNALGVPD